MAILSGVAYKEPEDANKTFEKYGFHNHRFIDKDGAQCYIIWNDTDAIIGSTGTDGNFEEVKLGDIQVKYNTTSQGTGSVNNVFDVYPWLQSYLGSYVLGGAGSFQLRVVRG